MRKNFGAKAILYPMPVLILGTYDENGKPNAMNAAWGGISEETQISICVDDGHKTAKNVVKTGAFTVSIADVENVVACDYVGIVSGNKEPDKIEKAGWHTTKSEFVNAPLFDELPVAIECKLIGMRYMYTRILTRVRKYTQNEKRKSSAALQNQKNCMVCAIAACAETKEFPNSAYSLRLCRT